MFYIAARASLPAKTRRHLDIRADWKSALQLVPRNTRMYSDSPPYQGGGVALCIHVLQATSFSFPVCPQIEKPSLEEGGYIHLNNGLAYQRFPPYPFLPPSPPPEKLLFSCGLDSLTTRLRPPSSLPLNIFIASAA